MKMKNIISLKHYIEENHFALRAQWAKVKNIKDISLDDFHAKAYQSNVIDKNISLLKALSRCDVKSVNELILEPYINVNVVQEDFRGTKQNSALELAVSSNCWQVVFMLVENGADYSKVAKTLNSNFKKMK